MNELITTEFEIISRETIKYCTPVELAMKTQEEKIMLGKAIDADGKKRLDVTMTARVLDISDEIELQHGADKSLEYLNKAKGIVSDRQGKIERRLSLITVAPVINVEDDSRIGELEDKISKQQEELNKQYTQNVAKEAILDNDLKRAEEVIAKLQSGDDVTKALNDAAKLREELNEANTKIGSIPGLKSDAEAAIDALSNAKTQASNLKMEIASIKDKVKKAEAALNKKTGDALLSYSDKESAKAFAATEVAAKVRRDYPLQAYLLQNGMSETQIKSATSAGSHVLYDTKDVMSIASLIYNQRNEVADGSLLDKIEALIADALEIVAKADNNHTHETLKNQWHMEVQAMTSNSLED